MPSTQSISYRAAEPSAGAGTARVRWVRSLAAAAVAPVLAGYLVLAVVLGVITGLATGASFSLGTVLAGAGAAWLAACHVPLTVMGAPLGVLPLLLTAMVVVLAARSAARAAGRLGLSRPGQAWPVPATIGGTHAVVGTVIAAVTGGGSVVTAAPALAFFVCGALGLVSATAGTARRCGMFTALLGHADAVLLRGLRAGALGMAGLLACGAFTYALGMLTSFSQGAEMFQRLAPSVGSGIGLFLLSVAYLPNALLGGVAFALGPGVTIGSVEVTPLTFHGGSLPAFPLLAAVPDGYAPWLPLLFVLPLAAGVAVGVSVRRAVSDPWSGLRAVAVAGLVAAVGSLILAAMASGALGGGAFGPVTIPAGLLAVTTFGWIVVPGAVVVWLRDAKPIVASVTDTLRRDRFPGGSEAVSGVDEDEDTGSFRTDVVDESAGEPVGSGIDAHDDPDDGAGRDEGVERDPDGVIDSSST